MRRAAVFGGCREQFLADMRTKPVGGLARHLHKYRGEAEMPNPSAC